jgi:hypothetical protein
MTNGYAKCFSALSDYTTVFCDADKWKPLWDLSSFRDFTQHRIIAFLTDSSGKNYTGWPKSLCTWWPQYRKLQVMFNVSPASLQTFIDTPNCVLTLTPPVIPNSNYVIIVSDWNCLKYFCCFCTLIISCTETFWSPCRSRLQRPSSSRAQISRTPRRKSEITQILLYISGDERALFRVIVSIHKCA